MGLKVLSLLAVIILVSGKAKFSLTYGLLMVFDRVMDSSMANMTIKVNSKCVCKSICGTVIDCKTFSIGSSDENNTSYNCFISFLPIHELKLDEEVGSVVLAKESSFEYFFGQDGNFYLVAEKDGMDFDEIESTCSQYVNGRIPVTKTVDEVKSIRLFAEINYPNIVDDDEDFYYLIGLVQNGSNLQWIDGTAFDLTSYGDLVQLGDIDGSSFASFYYQEFDMIEEKSKSWPLCQLVTF